MGTDTLERPDSREDGGQDNFSQAKKLAADLGGAPAEPQTPVDSLNELNEADKLIGRVDVAAATNENNRWNDMVAARRQSERAEFERDEHYSIQHKATLAAELVGQMRGGAISESTKQYLAEGGNLQQLLTELKEYDEHGAEAEIKVSTVDKDLADSRRELVQLSMQRRGVMHREAKAEAMKTAEERYMQAFAAKLDHLSSIPAGDKEAALRAGYLSQILDKMGFDSEGFSKEELAGNQMHVLTDLLCREQLMRQSEAEKYSDRGLRKLTNKLKSSKLARGVVAGSVFAASALTMAHGLPESTQYWAEMAEKGIGIVAAYVTSREIIEGSVEGVGSITQGRRLKKEKAHLASDQELTDLTLRTAYNQIEYIPEDRQGTADKAENMRRLNNIQADYAELQTAPGGKPYSAEMLVNYCNQLYVDRRDEIDQLVTLDSAAERKQAYQDLAKVILSNDVETMQRQTRHTKALRLISNGASVMVSTMAANTLSKIGESKHITKDIVGNTGS